MAVTFFPVLFWPLKLVRSYIMVRAEMKIFSEGSKVPVPVPLPYPFVNNELLLIPRPAYASPKRLGWR